MRAPVLDASSHVATGDTVTGRPSSAVATRERQQGFGVVAWLRHLMAEHRGRRSARVARRRKLRPPVAHDGALMSPLFEITYEELREELERR